MKTEIYDKKSDKIIDFLIGFFLIPAFLGISSRVVFVLVDNGKVVPFISLGVLLAELVGAIYLGLRRKYIGIGLLFSFVVVPVVLSGTCLLIMGGGNILGQLFKR